MIAGTQGDSEKSSLGTLAYCMLQNGTRLHENWDTVLRRTQCILGINVIDKKMIHQILRESFVLYAI